MSPEVVMALVLAAIGFGGWYRRARKYSRLLAACKEVESERQGYIDAARFILTVIIRVPEGYEANLETCNALARALEEERRARWRCYDFEGKGPVTQEMLDHRSMAASRLEEAKANMRAFLAEDVNKA